MGPLYHLVNDEDRQIAMEGALRLLKAGGIFVASFISNYAPILDNLKYLFPVDSVDALLAYLKCGVRIADGFTTAYFWDPEEARTFMREFDLTELVFAGVENILSCKEQEMNKVQIEFCNGNDKDYQRKLNHLLKDVFFDFAFWYDLDLWDENYESYSIMKKDAIISNICVYKTQVMFKGQRHLALSLGAAATKDTCRGQGLSRALMEHIMAKYDRVPMYLFANDEVLGFYPKFGFERVYEKQPVAYCAINNHIQPTRLRYDDPKIWHYIYDRINFSQQLDCLNTACINIFHIHLGYLKECLYEIPTLNTLVIARQEGTILKLNGVFSLDDISFSDFVLHLPFSNVEQIEFGFMPPWSDLEVVMEKGDGAPYFVRGLTCSLDDFKFPELSMT